MLTWITIVLHSKKTINIAVVRSILSKWFEKLLILLFKQACDVEETWLHDMVESTSA